MADRVPDEIQERFRAVRIALGLNQAEFGERLGLGKAAVSKIEVGGSRLTEPTILLLQSSFGVSRDWILDGSGPMFSSGLNDSLERFALDQNLTPLAKAFVSTFLTLSYAEMKAVYDFMESLVDTVRATRPEPPPPDPVQDQQWTDDSLRASFEEQLALEKKPPGESVAS